MLREAEIRLSGGCTLGEACKVPGISEQCCNRRRENYGGMQASQAEKLKDLQRENARLKKLVADQAIDKAIHDEALKRNYRALSGAGWQPAYHLDSTCP
jgi:hypothetical protein